MPTTSLLPVVLDALTSAALADPTLTAAGVDVVDGPVPSELSAMHRLYIGASDFGDDPGATSDDAAGEDLPEWVYAEVLTVTCTAQEWMGSVDPSDVPYLRTRAYATVDAVRNLVDGMQPFGLTAVSSAHVNTTRYQAEQTTENVVVSVIFTIVFQARTTTVG